MNQTPGTRRVFDWLADWPEWLWSPLVTGLLMLLAGILIVTLAGQIFRRLRARPRSDGADTGRR
jgi:hypothetical protein